MAAAELESTVAVLSMLLSDSVDTAELEESMVEVAAAKELE